MRYHREQDSDSKLYGVKFEIWPTSKKIGGEILPQLVYSWLS